MRCRSRTRPESPGNVPLGSQTLVTVTISGTEFKLLTAAGFTAGVNSALWLRPLPDKIRWSARTARG